MTDLETHAVERTNDDAPDESRPETRGFDLERTGEFETSVPDGDDPAYCPHCDRPFHYDHLRDLHVGEEHATVMTDIERGAYEAAVDTETDDLFIYHLKVVGTIVMLLMGLAYLYAFVLA